MPWFQQLCRHTGLTIHHLIHPSAPRKVQTKRTVEEEQANNRIVLRRTTIEEVEIRPDTTRKE